MAKQTALQLVNKVLSNLGETSNLTTLSALSGLSLLVFNTFNEILHEIATDMEYKYKPLEKDGSITLSSLTGTYAQPSDLGSLDRDSFRYDNSTRLPVYTAQRFDREYVSQTSTGIPDKIIEWAGYFKAYPTPNTSVNAKVINYRYWYIPVIFTTTDYTGTCWIPESFDVTLLSDWVTFKIMHYKHNEEAAIYYTKVFGDGKNNEGSLAKFKNLYASPSIREGSIMVEPM